MKSAWTTDYDPTIEDSYSLTRTIDGIPYHLSVTDTAGQEEYRSLASTYSRSADAFVLVYDITNPASLWEQLPYFVQLIGMESESCAERGEVEPVMLVAGNKCDLNDQRSVTSREGLEWARSVGAGFMETSARSCVNIEESFAVLVRKVVEARKAHAVWIFLPPSPSPVITALHSTPLLFCVSVLITDSFCLELLDTTQFSWPRRVFDLHICTSDGQSSTW